MMSPGQGAEAQPSLVLWASVRGDSLGDWASGGRQPGCHHGEGVPGCLQRAQGQLPQATCGAVRESSLGLCLPQVSGTLPPCTNGGHVTVKGLDQRWAGSPGQRTRVLLGASSLCTSGLHPLGGHPPTLLL